MAHIWLVDRLLDIHEATTPTTGEGDEKLSTLLSARFAKLDGNLVPISYKTWGLINDYIAFLSEEEAQAFITKKRAKRKAARRVDSLLAGVEAQKACDSPTRHLRG